MGTTLMPDVTIYCFIPITTFVTAQVLEVVFRRSIGCSPADQLCKIYRSFWGQRIVVLSIVLGFINIYKVTQAYSLPLPVGLSYEDYLVTPYSACLFVAIVLGSVALANFRMVRIAVGEQSSGQVRRLQYWVVNGLGTCSFILSLVTLLQYLAATH